MSSSVGSIHSTGYLSVRPLHERGAGVSCRLKPFASQTYEEQFFKPLSSLINAKTF